MASYRFSAKVIKRSDGRSATGAAAYRAGVSITDERTGMMHDYTRRGGVVHTEILAPEDAPAWVHDRATLWNAVEAAEKRKDAQLVREIQLSLPHELDAATRLELARSFVKEEFVARGMIADLALHAPDDEGDDRNHHAHVMLTMRSITKDGFGGKERAWNDTELLEQWREKWAERQNHFFDMAGLAVRLDHRSLAAQGIDREPEPKLGAVATQMEREGRASHAGEDLREVWKRNAERAHLTDQSERIELEIAHAQLEEAGDRKQEQRGAFDALYGMERQRITQERDRYQQTIDTLTAQLEQRSRFAVLWDKLRGRLGWRAEQELEAARIAQEEAQERSRALELSYTMQRQREAQHEPEEQENTLSLDAMQRAALQPGRNRNSQISSLEAWEATASVEQAERDAMRERFSVKAERSEAERAAAHIAERRAEQAQEQGAQDRGKSIDLDL